MDSIPFDSEFLRGLGILSGFGSLAALALLFVVLPIGALIDVLASRRDDAVKIIVCVLTLVSFGFAGIVYALFFSVSRAFRWTAWTIAIVSLALGIVSLSSCGVAVKQAETEQLEAEVGRIRQLNLLVDHFLRSLEKPAAIEPFKALYLTSDQPRGRTTLATFRAGGPELERSTSLSAEVLHVAFDTKRSNSYALTSQELLVKTSGAAELQPMKIAGEFKRVLAIPSGITFLDEARELYIRGNAGFVRFEVDKGKWSKLPQANERRIPELVGLAHLRQTDKLYALKKPEGLVLDTIESFNRAGVPLGELKLAPPIPVLNSSLDGFQLTSSSGKLVILAPQYGAKGGEIRPHKFFTEGVRVFVVNPVSGKVGLHNPRIAPSG